MSIDTEIKGNPENARAAASWLRDLLSSRVSDAASQIYQARNRAEASWQGDAGEAFRAKMTTGAQKTDELAVAATEAAADIDEYAAGLHRVQENMRAVRETAAAAGLTMNGFVIEDPGPGPASPGEPPTGEATPEDVAAHNDAVDRARAHADLVEAYLRAQLDSGNERSAADILVDTLGNARDDVTQKWFLLVGDLTAGAVTTAAAWHSSTLRAQSTRLGQLALQHLEYTSSTPITDANRSYWQASAGQAGRLAREGSDAAAAARATDARTAGLGLRVGGALAVAGVVYDVAVNDKPVGQAIVSGAVGFGASVAAGAAIGTLIPVPVLGTAVGAIVGAGVGIFASGMVDSLWVNHDVGQAMADGFQAVTDTGVVIGGLAVDAWEAVS
jgi:uncharacterized protein YukE